MKVLYAPRHPATFGICYLAVLAVAVVLYAYLFALGVVVGAVYLTARWAYRRSHREPTA